MKVLLRSCLTLLLLALSPALLAGTSAGSLATAKTLHVDRGLSAEGKACIT
jgi:hypothetical protein